MRIPTYVLIHQGHDRAVPRHAFASDLPEAIVKRHHKGVTYRHLWRVYEHNLQFLRELLLEGLLVKNGLLNRNELERYLGAGHHLGDSLFLEILNDYMPMEVWLRAWVRE